LWDETREDGNPWGIVFRQGLFNMASDSNLFRTAPGPALVPLYEAKMFHQYDHRWATYTGADEDATRDVSENEKHDPNFRLRPRYWVPRSDVEQRLLAKGWDRQWLLAWRDICRATDERTVIASMLPRLGAGDPVLLMLPGGDAPALAALLLLADQNSLVHDFVARQKVGGTHLKYHTKKQIATLPPTAYSDEQRVEIVMRVVALIGGSDELLGLRDDLERDIGRRVPWKFTAADEREVLRAELDAMYAHLYGLDRDDLRFVLDPAEILGDDYPTESCRILKNKQIAAYGEYRTRRLVLDAWDRLVVVR
jgi:hypothetical protein